MILGFLARTSHFLIHLVLIQLTSSSMPRFPHSEACVTDSIPLLLVPLDFLDYDIGTRCNAPKSIDPDDGPRKK